MDNFNFVNTNNAHVGMADVDMPDFIGFHMDDPDEAQPQLVQNDFLSEIGGAYQGPRDATIEPPSLVFRSRQDDTLAMSLATGMVAGPGEAGRVLDDFLAAVEAEGYTQDVSLAAGNVSLDNVEVQDMNASPSGVKRPFDEFITVDKKLGHVAQDVAPAINIPAANEQLSAALVQGPMAHSLNPTFPNFNAPGTQTAPALNGWADTVGGRYQARVAAQTFGGHGAQERVDGPESAGTPPAHVSVPIPTERTLLITGKLAPSSGLSFARASLRSGPPEFSEHLGDIKKLWGQFKWVNNREGVWEAKETESEREKYAGYLHEQFMTRLHNTQKLLRSALRAGLKALVGNFAVSADVGEVLVDGLAGVVDRVRVSDAGRAFRGVAVGSLELIHAAITLQIVAMEERLDTQPEFPRVQYRKAQTLQLWNGTKCSVVKGKGHRPCAGHRGGDYVVTYRGTRATDQGSDERFTYQGQVPRTTAEYIYRLENIRQRVWDILLTILSFKPYSTLLLEYDCVIANLATMSQEEFERLHLRWKERFRRYGAVTDTFVLRSGMAGFLLELDVVLEFSWLSVQIRKKGQTVRYMNELLQMISDIALTGIDVLAKKYQERQGEVAKQMRLQGDESVLVVLHSIHKDLVSESGPAPDTTSPSPSPSVDSLANIWKPVDTCGLLEKALTECLLSFVKPGIQPISPGLALEVIDSSFADIAYDWKPPRAPSPARTVTMLHLSTFRGLPTRSLLSKPATLCATMLSARPFTTTTGLLNKKKKKGKGAGAPKTEDMVKLKALKTSLFSSPPPPLRMARSRHLRHWTIHRAWLLYQRKLREARERELMRMQQGMSDACEELRKTGGPGTRDVGYLYRVAMEKKGIYNGGAIPIEYARFQTETPAKEAWNHGWTK